MMQAPESRKGPNLAFAPWASANRPTRRRVLREAEMRSVPMVVAHIFGHQPFQMALIQDDYVIQQVSSATSYPAFRNPVLPWAAKCGADRLGSYCPSGG